MSRGFKIAIGAFFALFLIAIVLPGFPAETMIVWQLFTGWVGFLRRVLPKVQVNGSGLGMLVVCLGLAGALAHGFCGWLWRGTDHVDPWRPRWTAIGLAMVVLMFSAGMAFTGVAHQTGWLLSGPPILENHSRSSSERSGFTALKVISTAQAEFRNNDRDWNHQHDYWRQDIAGLYALKDVGGNLLKLLPVEIAAADIRAKVELPPGIPRGPYYGHSFCVLPYRDEKTPDPDRFAACAFPHTASSGKYAFIISEKGILYRKPCPDCRPPESYPDDPVKEGWTPLD